MHLEIKVRTSPFTKYGVAGATIKTTPNNSTIDKNLGLIYKTQLNLDKDDINPEMKAVKLTPGISITAEIAVEKR